MGVATNARNLHNHSTLSAVRQSERASRNESDKIFLEETSN